MLKIVGPVGFQIKFFFLSLRCMKSWRMCSTIGVSAVSSPFTLRLPFTKKTVVFNSRQFYFRCFLFRNASHADRIRGQLNIQSVRVPVCEFLFFNFLHRILQGKVSSQHHNYGVFLAETNHPNK